MTDATPTPPPAPWDATLRSLIIPAILALLAFLLFQSPAAAAVVFVFMLFCRTKQDAKFLVIAVALALAFRSLLFEPFHIPSGSMKNNLLVGDYLFVSKYEYGYSRYSFPLGLPLFTGRIMELHQPQRGDVVVFRLPTNTKIDYIKRIMGLPGDRIQVKEGIVYINGKALPRKLTGHYLDNEFPGHPRAVDVFDETLPEGKVISILKERVEGFANNTTEYTVPPGHYFMMGDNRDNSRDSRYLDDVGYVPLENIVGRAEIIFISLDMDSRCAPGIDSNTSMLASLKYCIPSIRFNRLLRVIH